MRDNSFDGVDLALWSVALVALLAYWCASSDYPSWVWSQVVEMWIGTGRG